MRKVVMEKKVVNKEISFKAGNYIAFSLASILTSYPDENFKEDLKEILKSKHLKFFCEEFHGESWEKLNILLKKIIKDKINLDDIRADYIDIFDRAKSLNSLYETEYGKARVMAKTTELADLSGFYQAFGLDKESENVTHDMADHISVELEFYAFLLIKQMYLEENNIQDGIEIIEDARKKFMNSHLGRFTKSITQRPGVINNEYFSAIFNWIDKLVYNECAKIKAEPVIVDWLSSQADDGIVECALAGCGLDKN